MMNAYPRSGGFSATPPKPPTPTPLAHFVANAILSSMFHRTVAPPVTHTRDPLINHLQAAMNPHPVPHIPPHPFAVPLGPDPTYGLGYGTLSR